MKSALLVSLVAAIQVLLTIMLYPTLPNNLLWLFLQLTLISAAYFFAIKSMSFLKPWYITVSYSLLFSFLSWWVGMLYNVNVHGS